MNFKIYNIDFESKSIIPDDWTQSTQYILSRLLTGAISINYKGDIIDQNIDFSIMPFKTQVLNENLAFKQFLTSYNISKRDFEFINSTKTENRVIFSDLLSEFSHHFIQNFRKSHTASFIYLYRILERISYTAPLLYCKVSNDYVSTYTELEKLFKDGAQGDYSFFIKFLNKGNFIEKDILDTKEFIDFSIYSDKKKYFNILKNIFNDFESQSEPTHRFEIKFRNIPSLLTVVRNRFFHLKTGGGQPNIATKNLGDPDDFFKALNPLIQNFLAIVTLHLVKFSFLSK